MCQVNTQTKKLNPESLPSLTCDPFGIFILQASAHGSTGHTGNWVMSGGLRSLGLKRAAGLDKTEIIIIQIVI